MRKAKDHHPHFAGVRHGGIKVGEKAKRGGPAPGQTEFSAAQEKAMRDGATGAYPQDGLNPPTGTANPQGQIAPPAPDFDQDNDGM